MRSEAKKSSKYRTGKRDLMPRLPGTVVVFAEEYEDEEEDADDEEDAWALEEEAVEEEEERPAVVAFLEGLLYCSPRR